MPASENHTEGSYKGPFQGLGARSVPQLKARMEQREL